MVPLAEGIETEEQMEHVRREGCPLAQGYLFRHALDAAAFSDLFGTVLVSRQSV